MAIFEVVVDTLTGVVATALTVLVSGVWTAVEPGMQVECSLWRLEQFMVLQEMLL